MARAAHKAAGQGDAEGTTLPVIPTVAMAIRNGQIDAMLRGDRRGP